MHEIDLAAVSRVRAGEAEAFAGLVERHSRSVFRVAYRITGNESDADEIVQETFMRAYREIHRYESRASFATWIHTIARNLAVDKELKRSAVERLTTMKNKEATAFLLELLGKD